MAEAPDTFGENEIAAAFKEAQQTLKMPEAIVNKLARKFVQSSRTTLEKLADAAQALDFEEIRMTAHNIKGSAATLRFDAVSQAAREIEMDAKEAKPVDYVRRIHAMEEQIGRIEDFLRKNAE